MLRVQVSGHPDQCVLLALNIAQGFSGADSSSRMKFLMVLATGSAVCSEVSEKLYE